jgi:hypothetical protein
LWDKNRERCALQLPPRNFRQVELGLPISGRARIVKRKVQMAVEGDDSPMNFLGLPQELRVGGALRRGGDGSSYSQQKGCGECSSEARATHFDSPYQYSWLSAPARLAKMTALRRLGQLGNLGIH